MNTKNKVKIGFGTLAVAAFMTVGINSVFADEGNTCTVNNKLTCDTVTVGTTTIVIKGEVIKETVE
jgi:hypothetical protein